MLLWMDRAVGFMEDGGEWIAEPRDTARAPARWPAEVETWEVMPDHLAPNGNL